MCIIVYNSCCWVRSSSPLLPWSSLIKFSSRLLTSRRSRSRAKPRCNSPQQLPIPRRGNCGSMPAVKSSSDPPGNNSNVQNRFCVLLDSESDLFVLTSLELWMVMMFVHLKSQERSRASIVGRPKEKVSVPKCMIESQSYGTPRW